MNSDKIFSIRLNSTMIENNMKQVDLCNYTGIGKSAMSQYLSGSFVPKNDKIYIIAEALNVNPAWLLGYDVEKQPLETKNQPQEKSLEADEKELIKCYKLCSDEIKEVLLMIARNNALKNTIAAGEKQA